MRTRPAARPSVLQGVATVLLAAPAALAAGAAIAVLAPTGPENAIFLGGLATPLIWVGGMVAGFLAPRARAAAARLGGVFAASAALVGLSAAGWL